MEPHQLQETVELHQLQETMEPHQLQENLLLLWFAGQKEKQWEKLVVQFF